MCITFFHILQVHLFAFLYQRINEIDLTSLLYLLVDVAIKSFRCIVIPVQGLYRLAPRRKLVYHGHIQIAIKRHCQRAGNGCCRHHQDMGRNSVLFPQAGTLRHTETMLFVNDHQTKSLETNRILNDGMSADKDADLAIPQSLQDGRSTFSLDHTRQQFHTNGHILQHRAESFQVLFSQNFRWRHQAPLIAVVHSNEQEQKRHQGLSASHITLQQTVHLFPTAHIRPHLTDYPLLGIGQGEGQIVVVKGMEIFSHARKNYSPPEGVPFASIAQDGKLHIKQLLKLETEHGMRQLIGRLGIMRRLQRLPERHQIHLPHQIFRQGLPYRFLHLLEQGLGKMLQRTGT